MEIPYITYYSTIPVRSLLINPFIRMSFRNGIYHPIPLSTLLRILAYGLRDVESHTQKSIGQDASKQRVNQQHVNQKRVNRKRVNRISINQVTQPQDRRERSRKHEARSISVEQDSIESHGDPAQLQKVVSTPTSDKKSRQSFVRREARVHRSRVGDFE